MNEVFVVELATNVVFVVELAMNFLFVAKIGDEQHVHHRFGDEKRLSDHYRGPSPPPAIRWSCLHAGCVAAGHAVAAGRCWSPLAAAGWRWWGLASAGRALLSVVGRWTLAALTSRWLTNLHGRNFTDSVWVIHDINRIVNNLWRGDSMSYTSTPDSTKELWWSEFKDKYSELELAQRASSASSEGSEPSVGNDLSLWLEASGGCKGGGRILGMSSLSRTHRAAGSSSITSPAVTSQIHSLTEEVTHLKGLLQQRDQEMIRRDKQMRQRDNEIKKLQRKQDLILQHLQLQSIPGDDDDDDDDGGGGSS
ncbi:uncharacterized protein LOC141840280 [Curcuma longa]|uniref:uncharacterized protein LOC141840280 n=1 Tax=Curcuma longa TaxID=136217 RepID=UPI003D9F1FED